MFKGWWFALCLSERGKASVLLFCDLSSPLLSPYPHPKVLLSIIKTVSKTSIVTKSPILNWSACIWLNETMIVAPLQTFASLTNSLSGSRVLYLHSAWAITLSLWSMDCLSNANNTFVLNCSILHKWFAILLLEPTPQNCTFWIHP